MLKEVLTYSIEGTDQRLVLASPVLSNEEKKTGNCSFQDNVYCGLYLADSRSSESRLVLFGSKMDGFKKVERMIDPTHAQVLTSWAMYNFTSTDRSSLNLETGELSPLLITEIDQDYVSAELRVIELGDTFVLSISGDTTKTRLIPKNVILKDIKGKAFSSLSESDILEFQKKLEDDTERKITPIEVLPSVNDVEQRSIEVRLYGIPYKLDLASKTIIKIQ
jgi:hypothetical protein